MKAEIIVTRTQDNEQTKRLEYIEELIAQNEFDEFTENGNEHEGYLQWDLIVLHPTEGNLIRRTMYTDK